MNVHYIDQCQKERCGNVQQKNDHSRKCLLRTQCKIEFTYQSQIPYESKSGSKHPMLSISMAENVNSCKKETLKKVNEKDPSGSKVLAI